jgi:hypothetical protein
MTGNFLRVPNQILSNLLTYAACCGRLSSHYRENKCVPRKDSVELQQRSCV